MMDQRETSWIYNFYQMDKLTVAPVFNRQLPNLGFLWALLLFYSECYCYRLC